MGQPQIEPRYHVHPNTDSPGLLALRLGAGCTICPWFSSGFLGSSQNNQQLSWASRAHCGSSQSFSEQKPTLPNVYLNMLLLLFSWEIMCLFYYTYRKCQLLQNSTLRWTPTSRAPPIPLICLCSNKVCGIWVFSLSLWLCFFVWKQAITCSHTVAAEGL